MLPVMANVINQGRTVTIYHYTDANGLIGIIRNKTLWATDIRFLNDHMELYAGIESTIKLSKEMADTCQQSSDHVYNSAKKIYELFPNILKKNLARRCIYITSFSKSRDNLRQWMSYCPPNGGYAISFNKEKILISGKKERKNKVVCRLEEVDYQGEKIRQILDIESIIKSLKNNGFSAAKTAIEIMNNALFHCCAIKRKEFYDEREIRLVTQSDRKREHAVQFRSKSGVCFPYFEYPIEPAWIEEIIIGPTANMELARLGIEELLRKHSIQCKIEESECSLRLL